MSLFFLLKERPTRSSTLHALQGHDGRILRALKYSVTEATTEKSGWYQVRETFPRADNAKAKGTPIHLRGRHAGCVLSVTSPHLIFVSLAYCADASRFTPSTACLRTRVARAAYMTSPHRPDLTECRPPLRLPGRVRRNNRSRDSVSRSIVERSIHEPLRPCSRTASACIFSAADILNKRCTNQRVPTPPVSLRQMGSNRAFARSQLCCVRAVCRNLLFLFWRPF